MKEKKIIRIAILVLIGMFFLIFLLPLFAKIIAKIKIPF